MKRHATVTLTLVLLGCGNVDDGAFHQDIDGKGPGSTAWDSDDVKCEADADCGPSEACEGGVCQMQRCTDPAYASAAPMGQTHTFSRDNEIALVGDGSFIDGYESTDGGYLASWDLEGAKIVDVAGGNLDGKRPQVIAVATEYSDQIHLDTADGKKVISVGIWPTALAAGDVDADGLDELLLLGDDGTLGVCRILDGTCELFQIPNATGVDIAAADVDHDGYEEPVLLVTQGGASTVVVWNTDSEKTSQEAMIAWTIDTPLIALAAGDLDGDGLAEVALLEDGGFWDDRVHLFSPATGEILGSPEIPTDTIDIAAGDRDGDGEAELTLLHPEGFEVFASNAPGTLASIWSAPFGVGSAATRVAMFDWDGDSPIGRLVSGPDLVSGAAVPTAVLLFPPYSGDHSAGAGTVSIGSAQSVDEGVSQTVSLTLGMSLGFEVSAFDLFEAGVTGHFQQGYESTKSFTQGIDVGQGFTMEPDPDKVGTDYAGVVLSCGCFHSYVYETDDPANKIGGSGQRVTVYVPVGGQTSLWSTKRYNAMAEAVGTSPHIPVPVRIGDVSSYPQSHVTLEGQPIADADRVFSSPPSYPASDVGEVEWWLWMTEEETNEQAQTTTLGMEASLGILGVEVGASAEAAFRSAYSITVGKTARFEGAIPPVTDDPETPEDEFALYRYSFAPMVYREHYVDAAGKDAGYYVVTYSVSPPLRST